jgi:hypothetical protein
LKRPELVVSIAALLFTFWATYKANEQFKQNRIDSDKAFYSQLRNDSILNDSLIRQLGRLRGVTNNQLLLLCKLPRFSVHYKLESSFC